MSSTVLFFPLVLNHIPTSLLYFITLLSFATTFFSPQYAGSECLPHLQRPLHIFSPKQCRVSHTTWRSLWEVGSAWLHNREVPHLSPTPGSISKLILPAHSIGMRFSLLLHAVWISLVSTHVWDLDWRVWSPTSSTLSVRQCKHDHCNSREQSPNPPLALTEWTVHQCVYFYLPSSELLGAEQQNYMP